MKKLFVSIVSLLLCISLFGQNEIYSKVKIKLEDETLHKLGSIGLPAEGQFHERMYLTTEIPVEYLSKLTEQGISYEVLIENVSEFYVTRNKYPVKNDIKGDCAPRFDYKTPENFKLGTMGGFFTLNQIYNELDLMREMFPTLISERIQADDFTSHFDRPVYYVKMSDNPDVAEDRPSVIYLSLVHAREPMGMQQLFFYMWYLLENHENNAEIQYLLNNAELYFLLCANPDGYAYNVQNSPNGGGMWRANLRNNGDGTWGVDLNRNFGYMWGYNDAGSSPTPGHAIYRGPSAFSEPETQAIKWLCETIQPLFLLDYHTYGDYIISPWGYINAVSPDIDLYNIYSDYLTSENKFAHYNATVNANGIASDWYYGEQISKDKIMAWVVEAGNSYHGFWPAQSNIIQLAKSFIKMNIYLARFALSYAEVIDKTDFYVYGENQEFVFDIQRLGAEEGCEFSITLHPLKNVVNCGTPKLFSDMELHEIIKDSISFDIVSGINPGHEIAFVVEINNGSFSRYDTIRKIYGEPVLLMADDCSSLDNWTGNWGLSTSQYVSSPSSIASSPSGNYANNTNLTITTVNPVDLSGTATARLTFDAKWEIENDYDYVQLSISADNGVTWTALCGNHTVLGTSYQDLGQPIYEGVFKKWLYQEIDLNNWLGEEVLFRFKLASDGFVTGDGFYFDNFKVEAIPGTPPTIYETEKISDFIVYPNPTSGIVNIKSERISSLNKIQVLNVTGEVILTITPDNNNFTFDVSNLTPGIYLIKLINDNETSVHKLILEK